jgi:hypothetical protein
MLEGSDAQGVRHVSADVALVHEAREDRTQGHIWSCLNGRVRSQNLSVLDRTLSERKSSRWVLSSQVREIGCWHGASGYVRLSPIVT